MATCREFRFPSCDNRSSVYVRCFLPEGPVRGTVQIAHGIAEYARRYDPLMEFLAAEGWAVYANDHIGHGQSADPSHLGYVGEASGWSLMVSDLLTLHQRIAELHPEVPHFLFGHSMGSFLVRTLLIKYGSYPDGCILCGTGHPPKAMTMAARTLANVEVRRHGPGYSSKMLQNVMNGQYSAEYAAPRTPFDWISSDPQVVDAYMADPLCGYPPSAGLIAELLRGISFVTNQRNMDKMPDDLPVLFISGAEDPVGEYSRGVMRAYRAFLQAGVADVSLKLYPTVRHEILNDVSRTEVMEDVLNWLNAHIR